MKTIKDFITEKKSNYDFSCAMLYLDFPEMSELHSQIEKEDVYVDPQDSTFGLETEPHVTLLYGLHSNVGLDKVEPIVCEPTYSTVKAHNASLFENDKYDVLKFDIKGDQLSDVNSKLSNLPSLVLPAVSKLSNLLSTEELNGVKFCVLFTFT